MASISVEADVKKAIAKLNRVQKKQIPFALSNSLNDVAFNSMKAERQLMMVQVDRPKPFTVSGVQVKKSSKRSLLAKVFIPMNRWKYLRKIIYGGANTRAGIKHAIPVNKALENAYGGLRRGTAKSLSNKKGHFTVNLRNGGAGIFKRTGGGLDLQIALKDTVTLQKTYRPWWKTHMIVRKQFNGIFTKQLRRALRTAR